MIQRTYPEQLARVPYMKGYIYIAGGFGTVNRSTCGQKGSLVDNDPHFWTQPPTWGICRNDLRASANVDDVVFFVLPRNGRLPQSIFGYLTIERIITHSQAYATPRLRLKRMTNRMPKGNIIVNETGGYNDLTDGITSTYSTRSNSAMPLAM